MMEMLEAHKQEHEYFDPQYERLKAITREMAAAGLIRVDDTSYTIWHWDLAARNVMIHRDDPRQIRLMNARCSVGFLPRLFTRMTATVKYGWHSVKSSIFGLTAFESSPSLATSNDTPPCEVSGLIDWDGVLSVPQVLSRIPPQWLWCSEGRTPPWMGNFDQLPSRALTHQEMLIKGHFDQIMQRADPTYLDDAYGRGPWLRRLGRFAIYGLLENALNIETYEAFVEEWDAHYMSLVCSAPDREA